MNSKAHISIHRDVAMVVFVAAVFILAIVYSVFSATTISDNINTGGTLTVSGASSLGHAYASSTVQATGNILGYSNLGVGTTTPGAKLAVHGGSTFLGGEATIYGTLNIPYLQSTSTTASYFSGNLGIGTTTPGTALAVHGANTLLGGPTTIYGPLGLAYLQATSTTASYFTGALGIGTTTPGAALAVNGPGIFVGTSTIFGGLNLESLSATGTLGFYTRGTAAPRLVIDSSGNLGVATSGPATTLSTVGSGYFTGGLGVGYATTGSGHLLVNGLTVFQGTGRVGIGTTSPYREAGITGDFSHSSAGTTTISAESTAAQAGCIELRDSDGRWVSIYAGKGGATTTSSFVIRGGAVGGQGDVTNPGLLVIAVGRCEDND